MPYFYRYSLSSLLLILIPATVNAMKPPKSGDVVITMRNSQPCFSYPQDKSYSFGSLYVSKASLQGGGGWAIQIASPDRKGLLEPNRPETCIQYGVLNPGTKIVAPVNPLLFATPYSVRISAHTISGTSYEQKFASDFCITHDAKGETILVNAVWDDEAHAMKCLKPGESSKRSFWQKLFGK
jgi:hypothetical protein